MKIAQEGFTIVELLVSIFIAVIMIGSVNTIYMAHMHQSYKTRSLAVVNSFAQNKIEEFRSQGFLALNIGTSDVTSELPTELASPKSATINITLQNPGIKKVVLNLKYNDQGLPKDFVYTTFVGELGVGQY